MNPSRLFAASRVALVVTAMSFAIRGGAAASWAAQFHLTNEQIGWIDGTAFWGFTLAVLIGGPLCDALGMGRIIGLAFLGHLGGILLTIFAWNFSSLFAGTLLFGIANGSVEAACNPLIATLYPTEKTTKLNHFHVWFPGGIVIGSLVYYALGRAGFGWTVAFSSMLLPLVVYGALFWAQAFPRTERVEKGVSAGQMFLACADPWFLLMVVCMLLTASTEFGPEQWIPNILTNAGVPGLLVLAWITGLMAVGRQCAGPFVHRLSPLGTLFCSALLSVVGLWTMSHSSGAMLYVAATIFAFGVCFFWPTMLGYVNESFPRTGALGLAIMGGAGMLSSSWVLPLMGRYYDKGIALRIPEGHDKAELAAARAGTDLASIWSRVQAEAGLHILGQVALLPIILLFVFFLLLIFRRGHRAAFT
jgi:MFS family permease